MQQDIDFAYDRSGNLASKRTIAAPAFLAAGVPLTAPTAPQPADHGLIAWSSDPNVASATTSAVNGTLYFAAVYLRAAATVNRLWWIHTTAGVTPTAGANWAGLYDSTGARLAQVAADSLASANGPQTATLSAPLPLAAGRYWVALLFNAGTPPVLARTQGASATANNLGLSGASLRYAVAGTGLTSLPATVTPSGLVVTGAVASIVAVN